MHNEELDRILSKEAAVEPSPMFAAKVMGAVRREAAAPPPIAFPWKLALPGLVALLFALGLVLAKAPSSAQTIQIPTEWIVLARHLELGWLALALLLAFVSLALTRKLARN